MSRTPLAWNKWIACKESFSQIGLKSVLNTVMIVSLLQILNLLAPKAPFWLISGTTSLIAVYRKSSSFISDEWLFSSTSSTPIVFSPPGVCCSFHYCLLSALGSISPLQRTPPAGKFISWPAASIAISTFFLLKKNCLTFLADMSAKIGNFSGKR